MRNSTLSLVTRCFLTPALLLGPLACASKPSSPPPESAQHHEREPEPPPSEPGLTVSGLRGTLSRLEIQRALEPRLPKFLRCAQQRLSVVEALSGTLAFKFHIATNGAVDVVTPSSSSLGDRDTERCMIEVAQTTKFPAPHGGEAEFSWPLELPIDPEVRPPVELGLDAVRAATSERAGNGATPGVALHAACGGGHVQVTAYIETTGSVLAAGVAAIDLATSRELDCIAEGVRTWKFASPGSYLGKVTFTLP